MQLSQQSGQMKKNETERMLKSLEEKLGDKHSENKFSGQRKGNFAGAGRDKPVFFDYGAGRTLFPDEPAPRGRMAGLCAPGGMEI